MFVSLVDFRIRTKPCIRSIRSTRLRARYVVDGLVARILLFQTDNSFSFNPKQSKKKRDELDFNVLKQAQGIHAPLRLMMERKLCKDVGRLPFLPSSNLMLEVLEGREDDLDFSDFFKGNERCISKAFLLSKIGKK